MYCLYYQARLVKEKIWFVAGLLRAENNLVFDRSLSEKDSTLFEFFVPVENKDEFLAFIDCMMRRGYITSCESMQNRLQPQN